MNKHFVFLLSAITTIGLVSCEAQVAPEKAQSSRENSQLQNPVAKQATSNSPRENLHEATEPDLINGRRQFAKCKMCHTLKDGERNKIGPNLYGIFGRTAASKEGYRYSRALKNSGLTWDKDTLDKWTNNPRKLVPGTNMSFVGVRDDVSRRDLLAYVIKETTTTQSTQD